MFEVGKVYETVSGNPAKVLWIQTDQCTRLGGYNPKFKIMYVLHFAYNAKEGVYTHFLKDGVCADLYDAGNARLRELTLTERLYNKPCQN